MSDWILDLRTLDVCLAYGTATSWALRWFSLEEERVMQQSSVSISLSFWEPRYQSSRRPRTSHLVSTQTNKNVATNAIKWLSIPSRSLTRVRSDRYDKIIKHWYTAWDRYQSSRRPRANHLVPTQTNKNLATNAIKWLSIPSRPLARVRSDRDNKINIFGIFMI